MKTNIRRVLVVVVAATVALCAGYSYGVLQTDLGKDLAARLKTVLKEPLLNLLSSSEFTDQTTVKKRISDAVQALGTFKAEFDQKTPAAPAPADVAGAPVAPVVPADTATPVAPATPAPAGGPSFREMYEKAYGGTAWDDRVKLLDGAVVKTEQYIMKLRKDLSSQ